MITSENLIITMDDCRRAGHCALGVRGWMAAQGFDFRQFMREGLSAKAMLDTGDGQGRQVVARAVQRRILIGHNVSEAEAIEQLERGII